MTPTILLVDDSATIIFVERLALAELGCEFRVAHNGQEALEEVRRAPPNLILMDIKMPVMDGIEACRAIKADPKTCSIPIIMVTSRGNPAVIEEAVDAGCDAYVGKPIDGALLLARAKHFLSLV